MRQSQRVELLRRAATLALPRRCRGQNCESDARICRTRYDSLPDEDRRDCLARLWAESNAWKCEAQQAWKGEAQGAARPHEVAGFTSALPSWIKAEQAASTAAALEPTRHRVHHWHYLAYWRSMTAGHLALHTADFATARLMFREAQQYAEHLADQFPPFFGTKELAAVSIFIDAIAAAKDLDFVQAADSFQQWLTLFPERRGTNDLWFDTVRANHLACLVLDQIRAGLDTTDSLEALSRHLRNTNVPLPIWTLYKRVRSLAAVAQVAPATLATVLETSETRSLWTLFLLYTQLGASDKASGRARTFTPPRFLDIRALTSDRLGWQEILTQNLHNALYIIAEYERFRHDMPIDNERDLAPLTHQPRLDDALSTEELLRGVRTYLKRRDEGLLPACDRAMAMFAEFSSAVRSNRFAESVELHERILECFRFPHIVRVESVDVQTSRVLPRYNVTVRRQWNREPSTMQLQARAPLQRGEYYYLRPTWNTRLERQYFLGERPGLARSAQWVNAFWSGLFASHKVDPARFASWVLQFEPSERRFASILFEALDIYDEERVRKAWIDAFRRLPLPARRDAAFIGLGHTAKSGHQQIYYLRQALATLPEYQALYAGREKLVFRDLTEFKNEHRGLRRPSTFVFVDDFIGTGGQAGDFLEWYFRDDEFSFLATSDVVLMVLAGFDEAINKVESVLRRRIQSPHSTGVVSARVLTASNRAFSEGSRMWRDADEVRVAKSWATEIGRDLLASDPTRDGRGQPLYDPQRDALGWHDCQALISFHHNIPSDTLPIFWSRGLRRGVSWQPLQHRSD
jgi:hypothetical protein